jgi:hypothetical protein
VPRLAWAGPGLRLLGAPPAWRAQARVVATDVLDAGVLVPASPGTWEVEGDGLTFVPRFPFVAGRRYAVVVDGDVVGVLERPSETRRSRVKVAGVFPSGGAVPRNLLRLYVVFTGRMSDGYAGGIRFEDLDTLQVLVEPFLPTAEELWDPARTRLTLFLDPARIKRGLVSHEALGYPLREGTRLRLVIGGMRDAGGAEVDTHTAPVVVGPDLRHRLDPRRWQLSVPPLGSRKPLRVTFDRPLDHGLLQRVIRPPVPGRAEVGAGERSWSFVPDGPWPGGDHVLVVDTVLEDVAGNSLRRAFDRDLADGRDDPLDSAQVLVPFRIT